MLELLSRIEAQIEAELKEHAAQALSAPRDKSEFGFGEACGMQAGLQRALLLVRSAISNEDEDDEHGRIRRAGSRLA